MKIESYDKKKIFNESRVAAQVILDSPFSKEIRILMKAGQIMKEHEAPFPIIVHILEGKIDFAIDGKINHLVKGDILSLEAKIPHDLKAHEDSVVRLSLSKHDSLTRVEEILK